MQFQDGGIFFSVEVQVVKNLIRELKRNSNRHKDQRVEGLTGIDLRILDPNSHGSSQVVELETKGSKVSLQAVVCGNLNHGPIHLD
jgi:hypothetical protein